MPLSKQGVCSLGKHYQHLWNGVCRETKEIDIAENKHQLHKLVLLKGNDDEENVRECAKECEKRAGCLSFLVPYPKKYYRYMDVPPMCQLYDVQCEKPIEHRCVEET